MDSFAIFLLCTCEKIFTAQVFGHPLLDALNSLHNYDLQFQSFSEFFPASSLTSSVQSCLECSLVSDQHMTTCPVGFLKAPMEMDSPLARTTKYQDSVGICRIYMNCRLFSLSIYFLFFGRFLVLFCQSHI